ncbi:MAG: galactokinase [archaeon]
MIVSKTPQRISLGGGGSDLPFYANKHGGSLITAAIDKYIYITVSPRTNDRTFKLNYSKTEIIEAVDDVKHPLIKECLKLTNIDKPLEIHSVAQMPAGAGLGSSSAFTVGLLNALYYYRGEIVSKYKLAEDTSYITMDILKEPCGKQDQYASAFGSLVQLSINTKGRVTVTPINISHSTLQKLENNLMMFYTGFTRYANEILADQKQTARQESPDIYEHYHEIKRIGKESKRCLEKGDLTRFGEWMNIHWELKRKISSKMSNTQIDQWYRLALENGAIGGKIIGAGGGGFLLLYVDRNHNHIRELMEKEGLVYNPFKFDFDGSRIVYDGGRF